MRPHAGVARVRPRINGAPGSAAAAAAEFLSSVLRDVGALIEPRHPAGTGHRDAQFAHINQTVAAFDSALDLLRADGKLG